MNDFTTANMISTLFPGRVLLKPSEVADLICTPIDTIYKWSYSHSLPFPVRKINGKLLFPVEGLIKFIQAGEPSKEPDTPKPRTRKAKANHITPESGAKKQGRPRLSDLPKPTVSKDGGEK